MVTLREPGGSPGRCVQVAPFSSSFKVAEEGAPVEMADQRYDGSCSDKDSYFHLNLWFRASTPRLRVRYLRLQVGPAECDLPAPSRVERRKCPSRCPSYGLGHLDKLHACHSACQAVRTNRRPRDRRGTPGHPRVGRPGTPSGKTGTVDSARDATSPDRCITACTARPCRTNMCGARRARAPRDSAVRSSGCDSEVRRCTPGPR